MVGLIVGSAYFSFKGTEERKIAVVDPNGFFKDKLKNSNQLKFEFSNDVDTSNYQAKGYSDILLMPLFEGDNKADYILRSKKSMGFNLQETISRKINATFFVDDRNIGGFIGWTAVHKLLLNYEPEIKKKKGFFSFLK